MTARKIICRTLQAVAVFGWLAAALASLTAGELGTAGLCVGLAAFSDTVLDTAAN
jgi:hypothetical protein